MTFTTESATVSERDAAATIAAMLGGELPDYPLDIDAVADVCDRLDYAARPDELRRLASIGQIPDLGAYDAADLMAVLGCLEARRSWKMTPCRHDSKKSPGRISIEQNVKAGPDAVAEMLKQFRQFDFPYLLCLVAESDSREMRERVCNILMAQRIGEAMGLTDEITSPVSEFNEDV